MKLITKDYIEILKYYNHPIPKITKKNRKKIKKQAENILAEKLCRCIKSVEKQYKGNNEKRTIGLCVKSVLHKKNLKPHKFTCKNKKKLLSDKKTRRNLSKTVKKLKLT